MKTIRRTAEAVRVRANGPLIFVAALALLVSERPAAAFPRIIVGDSTAASCTQLAVQNALFAAGIDGGTIRFRCGEAPVTIALTATVQDPDWGLVALMPPNNTTIDGGGLVTFEREDGISILIKSGINVALKNLGIVSSSQLQFPYAHAVINLGTLTMNRTVLSMNPFGVIENDGTLILRNSVISDNGIGSPVRSAIVNNAALTINHSIFFSNIGSAGGAIESVGTIDVRNSIFSDNSAEDGGAIANWGTLSVGNCEFSHNNGIGGAIISFGESLIVENSTFSGNSSRPLGAGAIFILGGTPVTVDGSQFFGNAGSGGGAISSGQPLTIRRSTFSGNHADLGGAIYAGNALTMTDGTIDANTADTDGGGIYVAGNLQPVLRRTSVTGNMPNDVSPQP